MKIKIILTLLILGCFSTFAQDNPYEIYGHKSNVVYETRVSDYLIVKNVDTSSQKKSIAFNFEEGVVLFLGDNDSILDKVNIPPEQLLHWLSVDPLANKYPGHSPYNFCLNTPIQAKDPDGKLVIFVSGYDGAGALRKDIMDPFGTARVLARLFSSEKINKEDKNNYWGSMDNKFMQRINDYNAVYADASSHMLSTASYRYERGLEAGEALLKKIEAGEIIVKTGETIKIVSHSQGGAYAAGMEAVLSKKYKIEVSYNIAPKQPEDIWNNYQTDRVVHYGSFTDKIAPQSPMQWETEIRMDVVPRSKKTLTTGYGHTLDSYHDTNSKDASKDETGIFSIPQGEKGAVKQRKDNPK